MTATAKPPTLRSRVMHALIGRLPQTAEQVHDIVSRDGPAELEHVAGYLGDEAHRGRLPARVIDGEIVYSLAPGIATYLTWKGYR